MAFTCWINRAVGHCIRLRYALIRASESSSTSKKIDVRDLCKNKYFNLQIEQFTKQGIDIHIINCTYVSATRHSSESLNCSYSGIHVVQCFFCALWKDADTITSTCVTDCTKSKQDLQKLHQCQSANRIITPSYCM